MRITCSTTPRRMRVRISAHYIITLSFFDYRTSFSLSLSLSSLSLFVLSYRAFRFSRSLLFLLMGVRIRKCVRHTQTYTLARDTHILITNSCSRGLLLFASLWHQIPYSSQNGESASPRARWSTSERLSERDLHRILLTGLLSCYSLHLGNISQWQIPRYERLRICVLSPWQKFLTKYRGSYRWFSLGKIFTNIGLFFL